MTVTQLAVDSDTRDAFQLLADVSATLTVTVDERQWQEQGFPALELAVVLLHWDLPELTDGVFNSTHIANEPALQVRGNAKATTLTMFDGTQLQLPTEVVQRDLARLVDDVETWTTQTLGLTVADIADAVNYQGRYR